MISILKKITQNSRLNEYRLILEHALDNGYRLTSLIDWFKNDFYPNEKVFLLRHDVDYDMEGAYRMYQIEKELGAKSTFYYRWKTMDKSSMVEIRNNGFEVSLHFETLATYCRANNIVSADKINVHDFEECYKLLLNEIREFEERFWPINTLCSHGDHRNRLIGIPNHYIIEGKSREEIGIFFETYDKEILNKVDVYISDSSIKNNHEWRYGISPKEAVESKVDCICLLTHPQHWNYHFRRNITKVITDIKERINP